MEEYFWDFEDFVNGELESEIFGFEFSESFETFWVFDRELPSGSFAGVPSFEFLATSIGKKKKKKKKSFKKLENKNRVLVYDLWESGEFQEIDERIE